MTRKIRPSSPSVPPAEKPAAPATPSAGAVAAYRRALVPWYRENARDLPWRRDADPWGVWVSEMMLQQTRVETVIPYWERFLERFPDPLSLAEASEEDVLEAWSGLGYYRRARMLRDGARHVVDQHGGHFPEDDRSAREIPGIGPYASGAIRSIALGERAPILDGNVTRVVTRVFGIRGNPSRRAVSTVLWNVAAEVVTEGDPSEVNQAQMELGALVCVPREPRCGGCPLANGCVARREGKQAELPELPAKRPTVDVRCTVLLIRRGDAVLLRRRRPDELLPGMWDLPGAFGGGDGDPSTDLAAAVARLPFRIETGEALGTLRHVVTYRKIRLDVVAAFPAGRTGEAAAATSVHGPDGAELTWCEPARALDMALSSPARRILRRWA